MKTRGGGRSSYLRGGGTFDFELMSSLAWSAVMTFAATRKTFAICWKQLWFYLYVLIFSTAEKFCNGVPQTVMSQSHITSFFTGMTYEHGQLSSFPRMHILLLHLLSSGYISKQLHL